jgi:hypothetical protein
MFCRKYSVPQVPVWPSFIVGKNYAPSAAHHSTTQDISYNFYYFSCPQPETLSIWGNWRRLVLFVMENRPDRFVSDRPPGSRSWRVVHSCTLLAIHKTCQVCRGWPVGDELPLPVRVRPEGAREVIAG